MSCVRYGLCMKFEALDVVLNSCQCSLVMGESLGAQPYNTLSEKEFLLFFAYRYSCLLPGFSELQ